MDKTMILNQPEDKHLNTHIIQAYSEWCAEQNYDFYFILNYNPIIYKYNMSRDQFIKQVKRLFYSLECDEWGYRQPKKDGFHARESRYGRRYSRIERMVCIEKFNAIHAHVMMKSFGNYNESQLMQLIESRWLEIQSCSASKDTYLFQPNNHKIRSNRAVAFCANKETINANKNLDDVLCTRSSFIRK
jgi:hypothetical protein